MALDGTRQTLQLVGSPNGSLPEANVNFFMLVPTTPSPKITAKVTGNNISVSFATQNGYSYQLLYKNNLTDPTWTPMGGSISGDGTIHSVGDTTGIASRFYRLQIQ